MSDRFRDLHHVGIAVQNLDDSVAWYEQHLGFERLSNFNFPGSRAAFVGRGNLKLELLHTDGCQPMQSTREDGATNLKIGGINHFAIAVDDLDQTVADLEAAGVEVTSPPREIPDGSGDRFAFIRDNERMLVELIQPAA